MTRRLLELAGYVIREADNGVDAVTLTRQELPSLVIMDVGLPVLDGVLDGVEATRLIRQTPEASTVPIIVLSAYDASRTCSDAIASGCNSYLTKPVDCASWKRPF